MSHWKIHAWDSRDVCAACLRQNRFGEYRREGWVHHHVASSHCEFWSLRGSLSLLPSRFLSANHVKLMRNMPRPKNAMEFSEPTWTIAISTLLFDFPLPRSFPGKSINFSVFLAGRLFTTFLCTALCLLASTFGEFLMLPCATYKHIKLYYFTGSLRDDGWRCRWIASRFVPSTKS